MLFADSVSVDGRHGVICPPTTVRVERGEVVLVVAEPALSRTALSLVLSGRMKPSSGTASWEGQDSLKLLRKHSALVDSPEINAPEPHLKVRDLVAEDLSLVPVPIWRKRGIDSWLNQHGFSEVASEWVDALDPLTRLDIMARLSEEYHQVRLSVFDSPDRHRLEDSSWLDLLEAMAQSRRKPAVVAVVSRVPDDWHGPVFFMGEQDVEPQMHLPHDSAHAQDDADVGEHAVHEQAGQNQDAEQTVAIDALLGEHEDSEHIEVDAAADGDEPDGPKHKSEDPGPEPVEQAAGDIEPDREPQHLAPPADEAPPAPAEPEATEPEPARDTEPGEHAQPHDPALNPKPETTSRAEDTK